MSELWCAFVSSFSIKGCSRLFKSRSSKHLDVHVQVMQISSFTSARNTRTRTPTSGNFQSMQFTYLNALTFLIFRSTSSSQPNKVCVKCPSARPYVRPSTKSFFDFNDIWYVGRGRRLMQEGMQYDPIQGQGQGHEPLKVAKSTIFKGYLLPIYNGGWQITTDFYIRAQ